MCDSHRLHFRGNRQLSAKWKAVSRQPRAQTLLASLDTTCVSFPKHPEGSMRGIPGGKGTFGHRSRSPLCYVDVNTRQTLSNNYLQTTTSTFKRNSIFIKNRNII